MPDDEDQSCIYRQPPIGMHTADNTEEFLQAMDRFDAGTPLKEAVVFPDKKGGIFRYGEQTMWSLRSLSSSDAVVSGTGQVTYAPLKRSLP